MARSTRIGSVGSSAVQRDRKAYGADNDERARIARGSVSREGPDIRGALERLRRLLASGVPLRDDVPRGYYLNILV